MNLRHCIERGLAAVGLLLALGAAPPAWADTCGAAGQRACLLNERIPSCDTNLVEGGGQCVRPACGAEGQRPCDAVQRLKLPCDAGLMPGGAGVCVHPPCGRENQAACTVLQRIPSCDLNLVEQAGRCVHPPLCGRQGQAACTMSARLGHCDVNLVERAGVCTRPGSRDSATSPPPDTHGASPVGGNPGGYAPPPPPRNPGTASTQAGGAPLPPPATPQATGPQADTDRMGNDIYGFPLTQADPAACQATCNANAQCAAWTYVKPGIKGPAAHCFLKNPAPAPSRDTCCVSGAKVAGGRPFVR